jgi:hypothetical protein
MWEKRAVLSVSAFVSAIVLCQSKFKRTGIFYGGGGPEGRVRSSNVSRRFVSR